MSDQELNKAKKELETELLKIMTAGLDDQKKSVYVTSIAKAAQKFNLCDHEQLREAINSYSFTIE